MNEQTKSINEEGITAGVIIAETGKEKEGTLVGAICDRFEAIEARLAELEKDRA